MENKEQHVDWDGLVYYDGKLKEYIQTTTATKADQDQLRTDLEQLEKLLTTFADSFTTDKKHIYEHIEACKNRSATKEELAAAIITLREEIKTLTGADLSEYATKEFVEDKLRDIGAVEIPDNLVTTDDIQNLVTREELAEELSKIAPPNVDLTSLATKEELDAVEAKIPSVEGLASETYVDEKVEAIVIPEVPTKVSKLENDAGYLTNVPEEYVTDTELDAKGYLTEHQSLEGLATEQFVADEIAKLDCVSSTTVENIIEEKIEEVVTGGATVSSISYGTF